MAMTQKARKELGNFLRKQREMHTPGQFNLPNGSRRRTRGLRREEMAELLDISTTWYVKIEQGHVKNVSPALLEKIARTLSLSEADYNALFEWTRQAPRRDPVPYVQAEVTLPLRQILDALETYPAYILSARFDIVGQNHLTDVLYFDLKSLAEDERNLLRMMFLNPRLSQMIVDWKLHAETLVGSLRANYARYLHEPSFDRLIHELEKNSVFNEMWERYGLRDRPEPVKEVNHPVVGHLTLVQTTLFIPDGSELTLVVDTPANQETREKLIKLSKMPAQGKQPKPPGPKKAR